MNVSLIIPNWNGVSKLTKNLPKVLKVKGVSEFIVVDDGSSDESVAFLQTNYANKIRLVIRPKNGGFSSAVNTGVAEAKGDLVFLLNSDAVPEADCLKYILPHFADSKVFSVGLSSGGSWTWASWKDGFFWHKESKTQPKSAHPTLWASCGSGVFRKSIWQQLKGLDENFNPFYEEDTDIGYRAGKRGYVNIFEPWANVEHYKEPGVISLNFSASVVSRTAQRNNLLFTWKNITDHDKIVEHRLFLIKKLILNPGYLRVFFAALLHLTDILGRHQREVQEASITDEELLNRYEV